MQDNHQHSNRPDDDRVYWVRYCAIDQLPIGRQKLILARKAICAFAGLGNTQSLKTYDIFTEDRAYARLHALAVYGPGAGIPHGHEARDTSDSSKNPVSLEAFCKEWATNNPDLLRSYDRTAGTST